MFTGIVESTGRIISLEHRSESVRLVVDVGPLAVDAQLGASIAHNGCCLTVAAIDGTYLSYDLLHETVKTTNLQSVQPGSLLNLERSLRSDARLGGHFVTGHVDATGRIESFAAVGKDYELVISYPEKYAPLLVSKGCIAVDGMSLTVVEVTPTTFSLWIIPHTLEITCLKERTAGDLVNLEFDLLAKYTQKILATRLS